jgi:hypothetical protein
VTLPTLDDGGTGGSGGNEDPCGGTSISYSNFGGGTLFRKLFLIGSTAALVAGSVFIGGASNASAPKVDVSQDTISCNTISGTAGVKPSLSFSGTATSTQVTVKGTLDGCVVSGPNAATIIPGSTFSGKLLGTSNNCGALLGSAPLVGNLTVKWKAASTTPLLQTSSVVAVTTLTGGLFNASLADPNVPSQYGEFTVGSSGVTGAFAGNDAGASSHTTIVTGGDITAFSTNCGSAAGIKSFTLAIGSLNLG